MITWSERPKRSVWGDRWTITIQLPELDAVILKSITLVLPQFSVGKIQQKGNTLVVPVDNSTKVKLFNYLESQNYRLQNPLWE